MTLGLNLRASGAHDPKFTKYSAQRLEGACKRALEYTPRPSLKNIQAILASGQDKLPTEPEPTSSSQYGFTRGADYYDRGKKKC